MSAGFHWLDLAGRTYVVTGAASGIGKGTAELLLSEGAKVVVQARTAAVMSIGLPLDTGTATGTGTDCVVLACDPGEVRYAGLHTAVGEVIGAAVRRAVTKAAADWVVWRDGERARRAKTP